METARGCGKRNAPVYAYATYCRTIPEEIVMGFSEYSMIVDAKGDGTAVFYRHHGFIDTTNESLTLFLPLATVK